MIKRHFKAIYNKFRVFYLLFENATTKNNFKTIRNKNQTLYSLFN